MKSIVAKWFLYSLGIGLIPIVILGASQGGIAASPIILMLSILIGLFGAAVHVNIFAFTQGDKKQRVKAAVFGSIMLSIVMLSLYDNGQCHLTEEQVRSKVLRYIAKDGYAVKKDNIDVKYLGEYILSVENCQGSINYDDPNNYFRFVVDDYQNLYFDSEYSGYNKQINKD